MFTAIGFEPSAIDADGAHLQKLQFPRQLQHPHEKLRNELFVLPAKAADGVMIGMGVAGQKPHSQIPIGRSLNPPTGENPIGVTID